MGARSMNCPVGRDTSVSVLPLHFSAYHWAAAGAPDPVAAETILYGPPLVCPASATGSLVGSLRTTVGRMLTSRPIYGRKSLGATNDGLCGGRLTYGDRRGS